MRDETIRNAGEVRWRRVNDVRTDAAPIFEIKPYICKCKKPHLCDSFGIEWLGVGNAISVISIT